jgi:hypothetical protein
MNNSRKQRAKRRVGGMSKFVCNDASTEVAIAELQRSVERVIKRNKKVFDNLAKS